MAAGRASAGGLVLSLAVLVAAGARPPEDGARPELTGEARQKVVRAVAQALIDGYIYEDVGRRMAERVEATLSAGGYDDIRRPEGFARRLTDDLQAVSKDKHLGISVDRPEPEKAAEPEEPPDEKGLNYGFVRVEVLEGNVGYLDLRGFLGSGAGPARADAAMALLADVDALIIDLGRNGGGDERMVRHLSTYLFDRPTHLVDTYARGMAKPRGRWTLESVPGKRLARVPVYILTSRRTFSAAEAFAFGLSINGRVTVVGERTGGGGHFGGARPLAEGLSIWLLSGRTYDPRTGEGWEASGLKPDIEVGYDRALKVAHERAKGRARR